VGKVPFCSWHGELTAVDREGRSPEKQLAGMRLQQQDHSLADSLAERLPTGSQSHHQGLRNGK